MRSSSVYSFAAQAAVFVLMAALPGIAAECPNSSGLAVAATPTSATHASLFWQVSPGSLGGATVTSYALFRGTSPTNLVQIATRATPFYEDSGLSPAMTYFYLVAASGNGTTVSGEACPTTPPLPGAPYDVTATPVSSSRVTLSWAQQINPNSLAISAFRVFQGTSPTTLTQVATVRNVSVELNTSAGTTYYYAVVAVDVDGDSSGASDTIQVTMPNH